MNKKRIIYFDYLRIISAFAVIEMHIVGQNWFYTDVNSFNWQVYNFYQGILRWAVPVFVMISGSLFLEDNYSIKVLYKKYILKIACAYLFWSILYAIWSYLVLAKTFDLSGMFSEILLGHSHLWFLFMIIGLYIIVPFLKKIVADRKIAWYFVAVSFFITFLIPQCIEIIGVIDIKTSSLVNSFITKFDIHLVLGYSGYFVLGYLINNIVINKKQRIIVYIMGIFGVLFTIIPSSVISIYYQKANSMFFENLTVNTLLVSIAVFVFAKTHLNKPILSQNKEKALRFLSKCSFGVYLIHFFIIESIKEFLGFTILPINPIISVPLTSIIVFVISFLLSAALNRIPYVKKWIV